MVSTLGDIMSTLAGVQYSYHEYTGDAMMSVGDIMSTAGVFSTPGGIPECEGIS